MTETAKISARTVLTDPVHLLAFGLGLGLSPVAPGTVGTLLGIVIAWFDAGSGTLCADRARCGDGPCRDLDMRQQLKAESGSTTRVASSGMRLLPCISCCYSPRVTSYRMDTRFRVVSGLRYCQTVADSRPGSQYPRGSGNYAG